MSTAGILQDLTDIVRIVLDHDDVVLTMATVATDVPDWDSMSHIMILVESERHFGMKFRTSEIEDLHNVGEFVDLIAQRTEG